MKCPVAGCEEPRKDEHILCMKHWNLLPGEIQGELFKSFAKMKKGTGDEDRHKALVANAVRKAHELDPDAPNDPQEQVEHKDLGCANGWAEYPPEYLACREAGNHRRREVKIGNCYYRVICDECKISYTYDSSG